MPRKQILDCTHKYVQRFCITKGEGFQLNKYDPGDTFGLKMGKGEASELLQQGTEWLAQEQEMLYARDRWSLLLVFQAMDAAGKDSTIKHVMSGVNPQGCQVFSFKQPSQEDLSHDFMWRCFKSLPERGRIGIFNRSYYEEVLIVRVHKQILKQQKIPQLLLGKRIWDERLADNRALRGLPRPSGSHNPQVLPAPVAQGTEEALFEAPRYPGEELEVLCSGRART